MDRTRRTGEQEEEKEKEKEKEKEEENDETNKVSKDREGGWEV